MTIEQKIADILAESTLAQQEAEINATEDLSEEQLEEFVQTEEFEQLDELSKATLGSYIKKDANLVVDVKEDIAALVNGEELSEEFKVKATAIFEAAVTSRVKAELAKLEEGFEAALEEETAKNIEGIVEKVDGYLDFVVEQWIKDNELALERGIKSDILESFVGGLKTLFEDHNIDLPEEQFDVVADMEEQATELQAKLDEQLAVNVELNKVINDATRSAILDEAQEGLTDTDKEKFAALTEELSYDDSETFKKKLQTIRENYFTKTQSTLIETVVTDAPVVEQAEAPKANLSPSMAAYVNALKSK